MPTKWDSQAYLNVYPDLVKQMDPPSTRTKCFARGLIDAEQRDDLSDRKGSGHNRELLRLLGKLNDDKYEVFCQVLLDNAIHVHDGSVAEMRKSPGAAAASASSHSQAATSSATGQLEGDPFDTDEYSEIRMELVAEMDMPDVRNRAEGFRLITPTQVDSLSTKFEPKGRVRHNRELLRIMESGGKEAMRKFSEKVLPKLGLCSRHKPALDTLLAQYK